MSVTVGSLMVEIGANVAHLQRDMGKAAHIVESTAKKIDKAFKAVKTSLAVGLSYAAISESARAIYEAGQRADQMERAFRAITGSGEQAKRELESLRTSAQGLGLNFYDVADAYKGMLAAAKGTELEGAKVKQIFDGISSAAVTLGLSSDQTRGALLAVSQMMSKGSIQAEELRGQLGERMPGAFQAMAKAAGVSTSALDDMLQKGEVGIDLLPKFADIMRDQFAGGANEAAKSMGNLSTAWTDFKATFYDSEVISLGIRSVTASLNGLTFVMNRLKSDNSLSGLQKQLADLTAAKNNAWTENQKIGFQEQIDALNKMIQAAQATENIEIAKTVKPDFWSFAAQDRLQADIRASKEVDKILEKQSKSAAKYAEERKKIEADLTDKVMDLTLDEFTYKQWALEQEIKEIRARDAYVQGSAKDRRAIEEQLAAYSVAKTLEILREKQAADEEMIQSYQDMVEEQEAAYQRALRDSRAWRDGAVRATMDYASEATNAAKNIEQALTSTFNNLEDVMVDWVSTGKASVNDLVTSIIADFSRIAIRENITGPMASALSEALKSSSGGEGSFFSSIWSALGFHAGGMVGRDHSFIRPVPASTFIGAPRLHSGLMSDEFPAILQKGEMIIPKGGGGTGVKVNVINRSDQKVSSGGARFDGQQWVIDLMIDAVSRNKGGLRDFFRSLK